MLTPDVINSILITIGGMSILLSVRKLLKDRLVRGISWWQVAFFNTWGVWNLFYYSHLIQWYSLAAEVFLVTSNVLYLHLLIYYTRKENHNERLPKAAPDS